MGLYSGGLSRADRAMRNLWVLSLWILLEYAMWGAAQRGDNSCQDDKGSYCRGIGQKKSLSRCYIRETRCCATCRRQQLDIPGCPYGDRAAFCGSIGEDRPISDCYTNNSTCCQTCDMYFSGNLACPYGDQLNWCSEIGSRYLVSSCYAQEQNCCDTCSRFKENNPGCEYGDHENWCPWIDESYCDTEPHVCCATCAKLRATTTTPATTTTTTISSTTTTTTTTTHQLPSFHNNTATPHLSLPKSTISVSTPATYTGSPGRPTTDTSPALTSSALSDTNNATVIHSGETKTPTNPLDSGDLNNVTSSANHNDSSESSLDIICFNNSTHHKLRHDKHGGRHRSRGHHKLDIICKNVTVNSTRSTTIHYSDEEQLKVVSNITTTMESQSELTKNSATEKTTTSKSGFHGEKEFQGGIVYSSCPGSRFAVVTILVECLFVLCFVW